MHRHHDLCEQAVDPLEIAAALEVHGLTDRAAARFRHRDVFSLAEEMYARVPRDGDRLPPPPNSSAPLREHWAWAAFALLPGVLCAAAVMGLRSTEGSPRLAVAAVGALAVALALRMALGRGPLRTPARTTPTGNPVWTCWLLAYAVLGDGLLRAALEGGPDGPWPMATGSALALALAFGPAVWCARLFATGARRRLAASRGLEEFASSVTPLLLGLIGLFLSFLGALLALCGGLLGEPAPYAGTGSLGGLLLVARLLTAHGFGRTPAVVLGIAAAAEATALATVFAGRLPCCAFLATPVEALVDAGGANAVPALVCAPAALILLIHAIRTLTRASAHAHPPGSP
ncbi:membrane protein [Streptomyces hygroscopicus]|nr:membrane protein [Streptomyces hygroscopicus]